jgi:hypothetical protein
MWRLLGLRIPLGSCRTLQARVLVGLGMDILRHRSRCVALVCDPIGGLTTLQKLQTRLDVHVRRIQLCGALVGIEGVGGLVVAAFILCHSQ